MGRIYCRKLYNLKGLPKSFVKVSLSVLLQSFAHRRELELSTVNKTCRFPTFFPVDFSRKNWLVFLNRLSCIFQLAFEFSVFAFSSFSNSSRVPNYHKVLALCNIFVCLSSRIWSEFGTHSRTAIGTVTCLSWKFFQNSLKMGYGTGICQRGSV